jgi:hypothetical protein
MIWDSCQKIDKLFNPFDLNVVLDKYGCMYSASNEAIIFEDYYKSREQILKSIALNHKIQ